MGVATDIITLVMKERVNKALHFPGRCSRAEKTGRFRNWLRKSKGRGTKRARWVVKGQAEREGKEKRGNSSATSKGREALAQHAIGPN